MKDDELKALIHKYFLGETTLDEESRLKEALRRSQSDDPAIREAKAVLSYIAFDGDRQRKRKVFSRTSWRWVAATVAVLIAVALPLIFHDREESVCRTMIACREDDTHETAFDLISSQLGAIEEAAEEVNEEIMNDLMLVGETML